METLKQGRTIIVNVAKVVKQIAADMVHEAGEHAKEWALEAAKRAVDRIRGRNDYIDALKLLRQDHDRIYALFEELKATGDSLEMREGILIQLQTELELHKEVAEKFVYPLLDKADGFLIEEALSVHERMSGSLDELAKLRLEDKDWPAKLQALEQAVHSHVANEEIKLFPLMLNMLSEAELQDLGLTMRQQKESLASVPRKSAWETSSKGGDRVHGGKAAKKESSHAAKKSVRRRGHHRHGSPPDKRPHH